MTSTRDPENEDLYVLRGMYDHAQQNRIGVKVRVSKLGYIIVYKVGSMQPEGGPGWTDPSSTQVPHSAGNKHSYHLTTLLPHYHQYHIQRHPSECECHSRTQSRVVGDRLCDYVGPHQINLSIRR